MMIIKVSKMLSKLLIDNGADSMMEEVYEYALICLLNELFIDFALLAGAWIIGTVQEMILWIIVFNSMRMNIGGFHAMTQTTCSVYSVALGLLSVLGGKIVIFSTLPIILIFSVCFIVIYVMAPLLNPNHPLSEKNKKRARNRGLLFLVLWGGLSIVLASKWKTGVSAMIFAVSSSCFLLFLEHLKLNTKRKKVTL